jgi:O-antigen/teichoic acid export membrane protein
VKTDYDILRVSNTGLRIATGDLMGLARRSLQSSTYTVVSSGIQTAILFGRSILLARLLAPQVFGEYTFAFSLVIISSPLPIFGMPSALIHRAKESEGELAFRVQFSLSLIFNILWVLLVGLIGSVFVQPGSRWLIWVIAVSRGVNNLTLTGSSLLVKKVKLRRTAFLELTTVIVSTAIAIFLAWKTRSVISLVSTDVTLSAVLFFGYYVIKPVWRIRLGWARNVAKYLLGFGKFEMASALINNSIDNVDDLWVGNYLGSTLLGFYSRAYNFANYPRRVLALPLNQVSIGTYAELKYDTHKLSQAFFRVNAFLIRIGFGAAGAFALVAYEFIIIFLGAKWLPMLPAFRWMLLYTLFDPVKVTIANIFIAIGQPRIVTTTRIWQIIIMVPCLYLLGSRWGIVGIAIAVNAALMVGISYLLYRARSVVKFSMKKLFLIPSLAITVSLIVGILVGEFLDPQMAPILSGVIKLLVFGGLYFSILFIFEKDNLRMSIEMIKTLFPTTGSNRQG